MGTPSITDPKAKTFVAKFRIFLEKEFLSKEVSGRKVELDEVIVHAPLLERSAAREDVPVVFLWCLHRLERKLMMMIMKL